MPIKSPLSCATASPNNSPTPSKTYKYSRWFSSLLFSLLLTSYFSLLTSLPPNNMKISGRFLAAAILIAAICPSTEAQSESFADFRNKVLNEFNEFRSSILENYDKFLEGAWKDYDQIKGVKSNPVPKPRTAPNCQQPRCTCNQDLTGSVSSGGLKAAGKRLTPTKQDTGITDTGAT